ncbi:unnamed protein product, partial [Polarella glacialis]
DTDKIRGPFQVLVSPFSLAAEKSSHVHFRRSVHKWDLPNMCGRVVWQDRLSDPALKEATMSRISFCDRYGFYLSACFHHGGVIGKLLSRYPTVVKTAEDCDDWETFWLMKTPDTDFVYILTCHQTFISVSLEGVVHTSSKAQETERFRMEPQEDDTVLLQSFHGTYLKSGPQVGTSLVAVSSVDEDCKFTTY